MSDTEVRNYPVETFYSPGFSSLSLSIYEHHNKSNLILKFIPYTGTDEDGNDEYSKDVFANTSLAKEGIEYLYKVAKAIYEGNPDVKQISTELPCGSNATLTFEYKLDEKKYMAAYLIIKKNNETITFKVPYQLIKEYPDYQMEEVTYIIQSGLKELSSALSWSLCRLRFNDNK